MTDPLAVALGPADPLAAATAIRGRVVRLTVVGELDLSTAKALADAVRRLLERHRPSQVILDLRGLAFLDSSGLHLLAELADEARASDWRLSVVRGPDHIQQTIELVGLLEHLEIVDEPAGVGDGRPAA